MRPEPNAENCKKEPAANSQKGHIAVYDSKRHSVLEDNELLKSW